MAVYVDACDHSSDASAKKRENTVNVFHLSTALDETPSFDNADLQHGFPQSKSLKLPSSLETILAPQPLARPV